LAEAAIPSCVSI